MRIVIILIMNLVSIQVSEGKENFYAEMFDKNKATSIYKGKSATVDFGSDKEAKRFRTRIKKAVKNGPNFADKYNVVEWGCGSSCTAGVIVNVKTGKIIEWISGCGESAFRVNSKLLVSNPGVSEGLIPGYPAACETYFYLMNNDKLKEVD